VAGTGRPWSVGIDPAASQDDGRAAAWRRVKARHHVPASASPCLSAAERQPASRNRSIGGVPAGVAGACCMIDRRIVLRGPLALFAVLLPGRRGFAQEKVAKTDAEYQDRPKGQQRCEICLQFQPPGSCKLVAGQISPHGWCQFFAARENAR
jgi:hypothetical protein